MDYPHFSVNFVNFGIHKLSTLIKMGLHSCVKKGEVGVGVGAHTGRRAQKHRGRSRLDAQHHGGHPWSPPLHPGISLGPSSGPLAKSNS